MGKYNYDKKYLKGLSVGPFLKEVKVRNEHIEQASDKLREFNYTANKLIKELHPEKQEVKVKKIIARKGAKSFVLSSLQDELAYFRAGQYVCLDIQVGNITVTRPFSISSSPKLTLGKDSSYVITIKDNKDGFSSKEVNKNWKVGQKVTISGPQGEFYYQGLRDAKHIIAVAGGTGITPFISMAEAIKDGTEDFNLTIIYGVKNKDSLIFEEELNEITKKCKKVKVNYVYEDIDGFINAKLIKKIAGKGDYSLFVCGPRGLYKAMDIAAKELKLPRRRFRKEVFGEYGDPTNDIDYPKQFANKDFKLKVIIRNKTYETICHSNETLLNTMEKANIHAPSHCRSGECGWCHSLLVSGKVYTPKEIDGRRLADHTFNWIHPCASYPLSDIVLEVPYKK